MRRRKDNSLEKEGKCESIKEKNRKCQRERKKERK